MAKRRSGRTVKSKTSSGRRRAPAVKRGVRAPELVPAPVAHASPASEILDDPHESVLDVIDHLLTKGVMLDGDVTLGVAGVDLVYLRLSALLCAADRIFPSPAGAARRRRLLHRRRPPAFRSGR